MESLPPEPDKSHVPRLVSGKVREIIYSHNGSKRGIIVERPDGLLAIRYEFWQTAYWQDREGAYWAPADREAHLVDSVANARKIVEGLLEFHHAEPI